MIWRGMLWAQLVSVVVSVVGDYLLGDENPYSYPVAAIREWAKTAGIGFVFLREDINGAWPFESRLTARNNC
jgi:hypothetical protein